VWRYKYTVDVLKAFLKNKIYPEILKSSTNKLKHILSSSPEAEYRRQFTYITVVSANEEVWIAGKFDYEWYFAPISVADLSDIQRR
jgi:hypothetical protein